jgi:hypothetical protein
MVNGIASAGLARSAPCALHVSAQSRFPCSVIPWQRGASSCSAVACVWAVVATAAVALDLPVPEAPLPPVVDTDSLTHTSTRIKWSVPAYANRDVGGVVGVYDADRLLLPRTALSDCPLIATRSASRKWEVRNGRRCVRRVRRVPVSVRVCNIVALCCRHVTACVSCCASVFVVSRV